MRGERISDALQMLRDDIIEETGRLRNRKRKNANWRKWTAAAVAACLCIVVGLTAVSTVRQMDDGRITAEKITQFAASDDPANVMLGGSTTAYITKQADALPDLMWSPVQDNSQVVALPVYRPKTIRNLNRYADDSAEFFAQGLRDVLGTSAELGDSQDFGSYRTYSVECGELGASVQVRNDSGAVQAQYTLAAPEGTALFDAAVPVGAENEEILAAAADVLDVFNAIFGKNFEAQAVTGFVGSTPDGGETHWIYVYAWESSDDPIQQMYGTYLDYVYITFTNAFTSDADELQPCKAWYTVNELEPISEENTPLLSLEEAEEELEQGYIFLGHVCPVCVLARNEEMDFSDYDGVEIVYRGGTFFTYNIPYYAFYKQNGEGTYAVTYVPAVEVEGLEEYFKERESWHSGNG